MSAAKKEGAEASNVECENGERTPLLPNSSDQQGGYNVVELFTAMEMSLQVMIIKVNPSDCCKSLS